MRLLKYPTHKMICKHFVRFENSEATKTPNVSNSKNDWVYPKNATHHPGRTLLGDSVLAKWSYSHTYSRFLLHIQGFYSLRAISRSLWRCYLGCQASPAIFGVPRSLRPWRVVYYDDVTLRKEVTTKYRMQVHSQRHRLRPLCLAFPSNYGSFGVWDFVRPQRF